MNILKKLHADKVHGNDIAILSNFKLGNNKNILNSINFSQYYKLYDLSQLKADNSLSKEINRIKTRDIIFFSTALAFQGLESKIIIYIDPLDSSFESSNDMSGSTSDESHLLLFNAMGRANTFLYVLWDKTFEPWYNKRLKLLGSLMAKNEN